jgi:hypothetical protein
MPVVQQWVFTDVVSGETLAQDNSNIPPNWGQVAGDYHGPLGLYIIAQRIITQAIPAGNATYVEVSTTPYDATSALDGGYTIPPGL